MSETIELIVTNGKPTTTSLAIAERFGKLHKNVLQSIERLECSVEFNGLNFQPVAYRGENGELRPMYAITKDGFMFLAMGFTGKEAAAWKERFIAAFNAMERQLLENAAEQQIPQPGGTLFLSHAADIMVAADRTFRSVIRSGRSAGLSTAQAIRRANEVARLKTGVCMLDELQAHEHVAALDAQPVTTAPADPGGVLQFWAAYEGGEQPGGACIPILSVQAHRLYRKWAVRAGFDPVHLPAMVNTLRTSGLVRNPRKRYQDDDGYVFGPVAFLIPTGPLDIPDHLSEAHWLGQCVIRIEAAMAQQPK